MLNSQFLKILFFTLCVFVISNKVKAQDLLILSNGDSINCKIVETVNNKTIYLIKENNTFAKRATNNYLIQKIEKSYYANTEKDYSKSLEFKNYTDLNSNKNKTQFNLLFGVNYTNYFEMFRKDKIAKVNEYNSILSSSINIDAEMRVWVASRFALGVNYSYYTAEAVDDNFEVYDDFRNVYVKITIADKIVIQNFSPTLYYRTNLLPDKYTLNMFAGAEYNRYRDNIKVDTEDAEVLGKSFGINFGASVERKFSKGMLVGMKVRYANSVIDKIDFLYNGDSQEIELAGYDKINLSRVSVGVYFGLY
jgi:hypothetical protein